MTLDFRGLNIVEMLLCYLGFQGDLNTTRPLEAATTASCMDVDVLERSVLDIISFDVPDAYLLTYLSYVQASLILHNCGYVQVCKR
jgi:hypothetical protein